MARNYSQITPFTQLHGDTLTDLDPQSQGFIGNQQEN